MYARITTREKYMRCCRCGNDHEGCWCGGMVVRVVGVVRMVMKVVGVGGMVVRDIGVGGMVVRDVG